MAVLPFEPTPFFANKSRAFWNLQFAGWGGYFLLRAITAFANNQPPSRLLIYFMAALTGFFISLILSVAYRQLITRKPLVTWGLTAVSLAVAVGVHAFIDGWILEMASAQSDSDFVSLFIGIYLYDLTVLGAWSALYYAINFFLRVEEQADQLERLEAQATSAQLAMLRYQLNPHFLFNTLNSISTLVLLKQTEPANAMLTRLSNFLRHTLVSQPGGTVSVEQEVETLKLYLEIERMRFEERLQTDFRVEPQAAQAAIPSMLLQPLIENAIKYGVTPQEEGAMISLVAQVVGPRLRVTVSDTGPGIRKGGSEGLGANLPGRIRRPSSTGVGLANIRDRLAQAYGDEHRFEIRSPDSGGFSVLIELPFEEIETGERSTPHSSAPAQSAAATQPATASLVGGMPTPQRAT